MRYYILYNDGLNNYCPKTHSSRDIGQKRHFKMAVEDPPESVSILLFNAQSMILNLIKILDRKLSARLTKKKAIFYWPNTIVINLKKFRGSYN